MRLICMIVEEEEDIPCEHVKGVAHTLVTLLVRRGQ